jgi:hypothetical protein
VRHSFEFWQFANRTGKLVSKIVLYFNGLLAITDSVRRTPEYSGICDCVDQWLSESNSVMGIGNILYCSPCTISR